jgi:hypothetical protein
MTNFKVGDTVKIIGNNSLSVNKVGDIGILHECGNFGMYRVNVEGKTQGGNWTCALDMEPVTTPDVPIGYVGSPKDMNLKDGDVIRYGSNEKLFVISDGRVGAVMVNNCTMDYHLISRAREWVFTDSPNYTTHDVATHNGMPVAARKKAPVVKTIGVLMYADVSDGVTRGTVRTTGDVIDWSTLTVD